MLKALINREIRAQRDRLTGTVVSRLELKAFDGSMLGGETWVCRVDVGSKRLLEDVPVKAINHTREYAQLGASVSLQKDAQGRYEVVGPADRIVGIEVITSVDLSTGLQTGQVNAGFTFEQVPFEFYMGDRALKGNPQITFTNVGAGNDTIARDVGSFTAENFQAGDSVVIQGSDDNDQTVTLAVVTALVMEVAGDPFVNEGPKRGIRMGVAGTSRFGDGVTGFPLTIVRDQQGNVV